MVRADYTARAELHIRSNAASRSLTQTHTQHTTRPKRKKGTQNKTAQLLSVPHRPPRLSCPRWRHIAWHWTPSMRCVPPCRAHDTRRTTLATQTLLHSMHVASSLFRLPHERINMHETTQHTAHSFHTHAHSHTYTPRSASTRLLIEIVVVVVAYTLLLRSAFA